MISAVALLTLMLLALPAPALAASGHHYSCHHNRAHQLVCRTCWHEAGRVRCGQARIVR